MNTLFTNSPDGTRVAYEHWGTGPAIMLLHGGGGSRREWHDAGYVKRLQDEYTVIAVDLRGHGESGRPTTPTDYNTDKMGQDMLAAADACGVERFTMWGMSYGGKVGRYLAVKSDRVAKLILMGTPMGLGVSGERRQEAIDFCTHWQPIVQAQLDSTLDLDLLSQHDQEFMQHFDVPVMLGWVKAMLDWPAVEPADFHCPTLWLVGSEDRHAMASFREYEQNLEGSRVQTHLLEGLDHMQVFEEIDTVLPTMLAFTNS
jgi:pimeloyl-ACP methyl ester carboxylesterase